MHFKHYFLSVTSDGLKYETKIMISERQGMHSNCSGKDLSAEHSTSIIELYKTCPY